MHGHIRDIKEISNYVKHLTLHNSYAEAYRCHWHCTLATLKHTGVILWLAGNSGEMIIYAFLLGFFSHSRQKEWYKCYVQEIT